MIDQVNENNQLQAIHTLDHLQGPVLGMTLSDDGQLLATFCVLGHVSIWDVRQNFKLLRKLRDKDETQIDEFYCGLFKENYMLTAGKLKDRYRWSETDEDCHILPCPIKIFDLETDKVIGRLEGHSEEILCIKSLKFEDKNYYITTSQDGYIFKWHMENDWITLVDSQCMGDGVTCMAFTVSFLPNTGNKYFLGACDAHLKLYDFEQAQVMQTFENMYSSYCDCGKFIHWLDEIEYITNQKKYKEIDKENKEDVTEKNKSKGKGKGKAKEIDIKKGEKEEDEDTIVNIDEMDEDDHDQREYAWFISRGAEMCDIDDGVSSTPNTCTLHRLWYPKQSGDPFQLEEIKKYKHEDYHSNSWLVKIASNGRYLFAPTLYGQIFVFNILTGQVTSIIKEHQDMEVRDIIIHPYFPLLISCGDDGTARVYTWKE
ncbi:WD40-repeat-containing domain protein [Cunninghamella echinulata]|nr:WD40-repeat-containing domain protein [Cunninghamella echinulata]